MKDIIDYKELYSHSIRIKNGTNGYYVEEAYSFQQRYRETKNKMAYVYETHGYNDPLVCTKYEEHLPQNDTIFISPDCNVRRDIYRNSGYKITKDPSKADSIVFPALPKRLTVYKTPLVAYNPANETMGIVSISIKENDLQNIPDDVEIFDLVKNEMKRLHGYTIFYSSQKYIGYNELSVAFLPKSDSLKDVLVGRKYIGKYLCESNVPFKNIAQITPETLILWSKMEPDLMMKSLSQSNWQEYPYTLNILLYEFFKYKNLKINDNARYILSEIRYDGHEYTSSNPILSVTPKDWNMAQKFCMMYLSGQYDKCVYTDDTTSGLLKYIRTKTAIAPLMLEEHPDKNELVKLNTLKEMI